MYEIRINELCRIINSCIIPVKSGKKTILKKIIDDKYFRNYRIRTINFYDKDNNLLDFNKEKIIGFGLDKRIIKLPSDFNEPEKYEFRIVKSFNFELKFLYQTYINGIEVNRILKGYVEKVETDYNDKFYSMKLYVDDDIDFNSLSNYIKNFYENVHITRDNLYTYTKTKLLNKIKRFKMLN